MEKTKETDEEHMDANDEEHMDANDEEHKDANDEALTEQLRFPPDEESVSDSSKVDVPLSCTS